MPSVEQWMSWEGGVDLVATSGEGLEAPNIIVHVARMVHTPVGSAPSGMILIQPDPKEAPQAMGFISASSKVASYFGPNIFAGTPFESAPVQEASIEVEISEHEARATIGLGELVIVSSLTELGSAALLSREPSSMTPFSQQVVERIAGCASLSVNGEELSITLPEVGISGGAPAVCAPCGLYTR